MVSENSKKSITAVFKTTENKKESECNQRNSQKRPDLAGAVVLYIDFQETSLQDTQTIIESFSLETFLFLRN